MFRNSPINPHTQGNSRRIAYRAQARIKTIDCMESFKTGDGDYQLIRNQLPGCEFIVYEGLPHNITDAVPDRCAEELKRVLLKHSARNA